MAEGTAGGTTHDLERIDFLRERMGVGYQQARDALAAAGGNVVDALVIIEQRQAGFDEIGRDIASKLSEVIVEGRQIADVRVKLFDRVVTDVPTALVGLAAAFTVLIGEVITHCSVDLEYRGAAELQGPTEDVVTDKPQD